MAFWGSPVDVTLVADRIRPSDRPGTLSSDLVAEARRRGFETMPVAGSLGTLKAAADRKQPPILMVKVSSTRHHYFVAAGYSDRERVVACVDYDRRLRLLDYAELEELWRPTGHAMLLLEPGTARLHVDLGAAAGRTGRWQEAADHYAKAVAMNGDLVEARIGLGNARRGLGDPAGARAQYEEALRRAPGSPLGMNNLADVLLELGEETERAAELSAGAVAAYRRDHAAAPDRATAVRLAFALGTLGEAHLALDRHARALLAWSESLRLLPEDMTDARARRRADLARARRAAGR